MRSKTDKHIPCAAVLFPHWKFECPHSISSWRNRAILFSAKYVICTLQKNQSWRSNQPLGQFLILVINKGFTGFTISSGYTLEEEIMKYELWIKKISRNVGCNKLGN